MAARGAIRHQMGTRYWTLAYVLLTSSRITRILPGIFHENAGRFHREQVSELGCGWRVRLNDHPALGRPPSMREDSG